MATWTKSAVKSGKDRLRNRVREVCDMGEEDLRKELSRIFPSIDSGTMPKTSLIRALICFEIEATFPSALCD